MSITDELREIARKNLLGPIDYGKEGFTKIGYKKLLAIADRIDAEHEADVSIACRLAAGLDNDALAKRGYIKLPVDADGVPIRVGDVMEERSGHTFEVASLMAFGGSDNWLVLSDARNFSSFREPHDLRHVQPDSWERIIEDAAKLARGDNDAVMELVERCRRLVGEA